MNTKTYIIYHEVKPGIGCPDGLAAAWVCKKKYPDAILVGRCHSGEDRLLPKFRSGDVVLIVDFSFDEEYLLSLYEKNVEFQVIDHHQSANKDLIRFLEGGDLADVIARKNGSYVEVDLSECAATLAWELLMDDEPMPEFLKHIRDRDLWNFHLEGTHELHEAMGTIGRTFLLFDALATDYDGQLLAGLKRVGRKLLQLRRETVANIAEKAALATVAGFKEIPLVWLDEEEEEYVSDVCEVLYKKYTEAPFSACVTATSYSLRSDKYGNNTDVGAISLVNGGGGHRNAAGFPVK